MRLIHVMRALRAVTTGEVLKFVRSAGDSCPRRVRPLMWLTVFAAGFYNVFGVSRRGMIRRSPQAQPA